MDQRKRLGFFTLNGFNDEEKLLSITPQIDVGCEMAKKLCRERNPSSLGLEIDKCTRHIRSLLLMRHYEYVLSTSFVYLDFKPSKEVRSKAIDVLNLWLKTLVKSLGIIKLVNNV